MVKGKVGRAFYAKRYKRRQANAALNALDRDHRARERGAERELRRKANAAALADTQAARERERAERWESALAAAEIAGGARAAQSARAKADWARERERAERIRAEGLRESATAARLARLTGGISDAGLTKSAESAAPAPPESAAERRAGGAAMRRFRRWLRAQSADAPESAPAQGGERARRPLTMPAQGGERRPRKYFTAKRLAGASSVSFGGGPAPASPLERAAGAESRVAPTDGAERPQSAPESAEGAESRVAPPAPAERPPTRPRPPRVPGFSWGG